MGDESSTIENIQQTIIDEDAPGKHIFFLNIIKELVSFFLLK